MRKDYEVPQGTVHSLWIDSQSLKGNFLGDPSRRRVDVYIPAGHDGRDLPLLVDLVGYTAGGPVWKNHLFFMSNFEGYRDRKQFQNPFSVPSTAMLKGRVFAVLVK